MIFFMTQEYDHNIDDGEEAFLSISLDEHGPDIKTLSILIIL